MVRAVNALDYGLTCSIWTNDLATAHRTASAVEAGYVWVNDVGRHFPEPRLAVTSNPGSDARSAWRN